MTSREEYFARVEPLLGRGLADATVAIERPSLTARVIELLAGCRLQRVIVRDAHEPVRWPLGRLYDHPDLCAQDLPAAGLLAHYFAWKNDVVPMEWLTRGAADVLVSARLAPPGRTPRIDWDDDRVTMVVPVGDLFAFQNLSYHVARQVRERLQGPASPPAGSVHYGTSPWPFAAGRRAFDAPEPSPSDLAGKHILVVGCGSIGSEAIRTLHGQGARWTLVDGAEVSVFNPLRQWFGSQEIGTPKVEALARRMRPEQVHGVAERAGVERLAGLLDSDPPDLVLLSTGTQNDDAALAELLWRRGVPHVAAYAYPQARFFEATVVVPGEGTPCLHCFRGHLFRGTESRTPIDDELASFLYREVAEEERDRLYQDLVAEPASPIETGRLADVVSQCGLQLVASPERRSAWFARMLDASTTCLLGGNVVERHEDGECAYGLTYPGQVVRLGLDDIMGMEARRVCRVCGRELQVRVRLDLPAADDVDVDRGLLG